MILIQDGKRYDEKKFGIESDFEAEILASKDVIFGKDTIYIDAKKKINVLLQDIERNGNQGNGS